MQNHDKQEFKISLSGLMEVYGKPEPTNNVLRVWWDVLKEFNHTDVFTTLSYWPTYNSKPPVPADIWKQLNEKRTEHIEHEAKKNSEMNRTEPHLKTENGMKMLKLIKESLAKPKSNKIWWQKILENTEKYPYYSQKLAKEASEYNAN